MLYPAMLHHIVKNPMIIEVVNRAHFATATLLYRRPYGGRRCVMPFWTRMLRASWRVSSQLTCHSLPRTRRLTSYWRLGLLVATLGLHVLTRVVGTDLAADWQAIAGHVRRQYRPCAYSYLHEQATGRAGTRALQLQLQPRGLLTVIFVPGRRLVFDLGLPKPVAVQAYYHFRR